MKKVFLATTLATSIFALTACGSSDMSSIIMTSDSGDITAEEFYDGLKSQNTSSSILQQLVIEKVFLDKYEVSDEEIEAELEIYKDQYGDDFESTIQSYGYADEGDFKNAIKGNLAIVKGVESTITDEELEAANQPKLTASHILVEDEETAKEVKEKLDKGADFAELATEYSTDTSTTEDGGNLGTFGYGDMEEAFEEAAYALEVGKVSDPVETSSGYHIIKLTDKVAAVSFKELTDEEISALKDTIVSKKYNDGSYEKIVSNLLEEANVKVKDKSFEGLFDFSDDSSE